MATSGPIVEPQENPPLTDLIKEGDFYKMQTFDQHLYSLVHDAVVTYEEALAVATNPHDLTVELRGAGIVA